MNTMSEAGIVPAMPNSTDPSTATESWLDTLDDHAAEHGFHVRLGARHGVLYTEDDESLLLVSFENAPAIRMDDPALPYGLKVAGKEGWSQLTFYSEGTTWFRDPDVYSFVDDLVDDGFFDLFDNVFFYGVGAEGYAACAYSVAAPGARVLAVRPHATQDPRRAGWDKRFPGARRLSFDDRYGDAPALLEAADQAILVYDPMETEDAMHAALLGRNALHLRTPHLGPDPERQLDDLNALERIVRLAARGKLDAPAFARFWRRRRQSSAYQRRVLAHLRQAERPYLQALWCRAALRQAEKPRLRRGLEDSLAALDAAGKELPPEPPAPPRLESAAG